MSNLAQYIPDVRLYVGDIDSTEYSDSTVLTALKNGVLYLQRQWYTKYLIYSSGIVASYNGSTVTVNVPNGQCTIDTPLEGDVFRNCNFPFTSNPPPIIEQNDLPALLLAASYLLARSKASSSTSGLSWSTPDLSYSNIESAKTYKELMRQNLEAISLFFKQKLGAVQVGRNSYRIEWYNNPVDAANFYFNLAKETLK